MKAKKNQAELQAKMQQHSMFVTNKRVPCNKQRDNQLKKNSYIPGNYYLQSKAKKEQTHQ